MKPGRGMGRRLAAVVLVLPLLGCGAVRNPNGMYRNEGAGRADAAAGVSAADLPERDLRTPQEILEGKEADYHPQMLPGFAREAVPNRVMLQEQINAGYNDSPSMVD